MFVYRSAVKLITYMCVNIIRVIKSGRMRWAGNVARMGETRNPYNILDGKSEGNGSLGRRKRRWKNNIRMDLLEIR